MQWLDKFLYRWRARRYAQRQARLRLLAAESGPAFQWLLIHCGTAEQSRSPMLTEHEIRPWFREEIPLAQIVQIDEQNHVLFYSK